MMDSGFVHLHVHSEYSLLDGAGRIKDLVKRASELDMPALALTDHGVMYGVVEFYEACIEAGIKPIIGCEIYYTTKSRFDRGSRQNAEAYHLLLLCENDVGYRNLIKIVSKAHLEGFYYKPRADKELLAECHEGLIATSACLASPICKAILRDDTSEAELLANEFREIFGPDNFFLELQNHNMIDQQKVNEALFNISGKLAIPLIVTNDVHYVRADDAQAQDVLLAINTGNKFLEDENRLRFKNHQFYLKSADEMAVMFSDYPKGLAMTIEIAQRCCCNLPLGGTDLPHYEVPDQLTPEQFLSKLCHERLLERYPDPTDEVRRRLDYELKVIYQKGYAGYFLIIWDIVNYARSKNVLVGPGRGSAAGCLVSYLLGITNIDPIKYGLMFERFLNPERQSSPDIDLDFPDNKRDEILSFVKAKYGEDHVAQIVTFGTLQARAAVRDSGRVLKIDPTLVDKVAKLIPPKMSLDEAMEFILELKQLYESDETSRKWLDTAKAIEGLVRHASTHPCGVVIGSRPLIQLVPLQRGHDGGIITQYDGNSVEKIGLVKMDFLGLRNSTIIGHTIELVKNLRGIEIDLNKLNLNDPKTYFMLSEGHTVGVFQMEKPGWSKLLQELKPDRFEHLVPLLAIYRPGPMDEIPFFIRRRHGEPVQLLHPKLASILQDTFGVMLYQEQVMLIAHELAGFSMPQAEILMRAMGKKKAELMEKMRPLFINGAVEHGVSKDIAQQIWERMSAFASYAFNRSHSAAYALVAYQTAYLKANYPVEYMTAFLSANKNFREKIAVGLSECRRLKIPVLPPDINKSSYDFTIEAIEDSELTPDNGGLQGAIRFGLGAVKNVGDHAIEAILKARQNLPFKDIVDFLRRVRPQRVVTKTTVECLIKIGAFDNLHPNRNQLLQVLDTLWEKVGKNGQFVTAQTSLFDEPTGVTTNSPIFPVVADVSIRQKLDWERELIGVFLSTDPLQTGYTFIAHRLTHTLDELSSLSNRTFVKVWGMVDSLRLITDRQNRPILLAKLHDHSGGTAEVILSGNAYKSYAHLFEKDAFVYIKGTVRSEETFRNGKNGNGYEEDQHVITRVVPKSVESFLLDNAIDFAAKENNLKGSPSNKATPTLQIILSPEMPQLTLMRLRKLLLSHPGDTPVETVIQNNTSPKRTRLKVQVNLNQVLYQKLVEMLGKESVKIQ